MPVTSVSEPVPIIISTGFSGAGKSLFLKALEDLGYETIDNLPVMLLREVVFDQRKATSVPRPLAVGIDVRSRDFEPAHVLQVIHDLRQQGAQIRLVFFESDTPVLERRFRETRRHHPLSEDHDLAKGIAAEAALLSVLREIADDVIDTSLLSPPELKGVVRNRFGFKEQRTLLIQVVSFAFKNGIPREADMLFDMRFLKNPYYEAPLRHLTGQTSAVQNYIGDMPAFQEFIGLVKKTLTLILPSIAEEGRPVFVVGFGCTGGQHRSVFTAQSTFEWLNSQGYSADLYHREIRG